MMVGNGGINGRLNNTYYGILVLMVEWYAGKDPNPCLRYLRLSPSVIVKPLW